MDAQRKITVAGVISEGIGLGIKMQYPCWELPYFGCLQSGFPI